MKPTDFPVERVANLERQFVNQADQAHHAARVAAKDLDATLQHGHAEAAFAYLHAARDVNIIANRIIADLDRAAAQQADPHTWPIDRLVNLDEELSRERPETMRRRHPLWGIAVEHRAKWAHLGVSASTFEGEFLLYTFVGDDPPGDGDFLNVDIEHWRALNQLVERIAAGKPTPYNQLGDIATQEDVK